jgi:PAS domain S-box-containing protein
VRLVKMDGSSVRVLIVEAEGLGHGAVEGILDPAPRAEVVRAASVSQARELLRAGDFDVVVADGSRLRGVLDAIFAFVGLFSLDGVVLDSNQSPLSAGGLEPDEVIGHEFVSLPWFSHSEIERARVRDAIARAAHGESARFETNILSRAGGIVYIDAAFAPLRGSDGTITHVVGTGVDVTVRRKAERELARSQARLSEAQRVAHVGSWEWDIGRNRVIWSDELYRIYGVDRAKHVPSYSSFLESVHEDDRAHTMAVLGKAQENASPFVYDHRILRPDGSIRMLHTRGDVVCVDGRPARLVGSCWDITDRWEAMRRAELALHDVERSAAELRALGARLADIREEERRVIARELHDQVGQALTVLKFDVAWLRGQPQVGGRAELEGRLARMDETLATTLDTTRRISASLRPPALDDLGLAAAVEAQTRDFEELTGVACEVRVPSDAASVAPATALTLFRILQEALTNVARHADARRAFVTLEIRRDEVVLTVADDGKGIEAAALVRPTSLGLVGMRERALAIAGTVAIAGEPGRGTTLTVKAPLTPVSPASR